MAGCALIASAACTSTTKTPVTAAPSPATAGKGCARIHTGGAARLGPTRASSAIALAKGQSGDRRAIAYIADADEPTLHTVDLAGPTEVATTPLIGRPEHVLVLGDGRVAVTLRASNAIQVLEPAVEADMPLETRCVVGTPTEPIALALTPDDGTVLLTTGWGHRLSAYDAQTFAPQFEASLPRDPRSAVVSEDGTRAFVAHVVGARMSVVDLTTPAHEVRSIDLAARASGEESDNSMLKGCQGFALTRLEGHADGKLAKMVDRVFAPMWRSTPARGSPNRAATDPTGPPRSAKWPSSTPRPNAL